MTIQNILQETASRVKFVYCKEVVQKTLTYI